MAVRQRKKSNSKWRYVVHPAPHFVEIDPVEVKLSLAASKMRTIDEWLEKYGPLTLDRRASKTTPPKKQERK
jgi:hypothetical protein